MWWKLLLPSVKIIFSFSLSFPPFFLSFLSSPLFSIPHPHSFPSSPSAFSFSHPSNPIFSRANVACVVLRTCDYKNEDIQLVWSQRRRRKPENEDSRHKRSKLLGLLLTFLTFANLEFNFFFFCFFAEIIILYKNDFIIGVSALIFSYYLRMILTGEPLIGKWHEIIFALRIGCGWSRNFPAFFLLKCTFTWRFQLLDNFSHHLRRICSFYFCYLLAVASNIS